MPLDRLSALQRALIRHDDAPRVKLALNRSTFSTVVHGVQLVSTNSLNVRPGQDHLMPQELPQHPSAFRPAAANLSHDVVLSEPDRANGQGCAPDDVPRHDIVVPPDDESEKRQAQKEPGSDVARTHDHSSLENDSHFHHPTTLAEPHPTAYQSPKRKLQKYVSDSQKS